MVLLDRVFCNYCESYIGQLYSTTPVVRFCLEDQTVPPHFAVCPDCALPGNFLTQLPVALLESLS